MLFVLTREPSFLTRVPPWLKMAQDPQRSAEQNSFCFFPQRMMVGAPFDDHYFGDHMYQCVFVFVLFVCVTVTMMIFLMPSNCKTVDMFSSFFSLSQNLLWLFLVQGQKRTMVGSWPADPAQSISRFTTQSSVQ